MAEEAGNRKLPIIVGQYEAQAIAVQIENIPTSRPMTHDLFVNFSKQFDIQVSEVFIHRLHEGVFFSILVCQRDGEEVHVDSRTSDAIALAVRFDCPIFTTEKVLAEAGIELEENDLDEPGRNTPDRPKGGSFTDMLKSASEEELNSMLDDALSKEDYMKAAQIRDEMDQRK
jgi:bifunctional DNase/RNase